MARVTIRVPEEKKEEWRDAVEDSREYDSLTRLIELAVYRELEGQPQGSGGGGPTEAYDPDVSNTEVLEKIRDLQRDLNEVSLDVATVKDELYTNRGAGGRYWNELPENEADAVTPEELAEQFNDAVDAVDVRDGIERMDEQIQSGELKTVLIDGKTHFYKEV
jgi:hypothetical protein